MDTELFIYESLSGMFPSDIVTGHFANSVYVIGMMREAEPVIVHHLVTKGTMDERVLQVLSKKEKGQNDLLRALKAQIEEMKA